MARKSTEEKKAEFIEFWKDENENIGNERLKNSNTGIEKMPKKKRTLTLADYKYKKRIKEAMIPSKEYIEMMHKNYPDLTEKQILDLLKKQKKYIVSFHHQHEGITAELIKKYLLLDKYDSDVVKITLDTPEMHDCNLVKLTPELQEKSYWGYRGDRNIISHLIDREDYPRENKTNKLTVIGKRDVWMDYDEDGNDEYGELYFYVITAFWGDGKSKREPKEDYLGNYDYNEMEFWINHALIPEKNEEIRVTRAPYWVNEYFKRKKAKEIESIYEKGKDLEYQAFTEYVRKLLVKLGRKYDEFEIIKEKNFYQDETEKKRVSDTQYVMVLNKGKFGIIRINNSNIIVKCDEENDGYEKDVEKYRKEIMEKDYIQNFKAEIIKDINHQDSNVPQEVREYRKAFISRKCNNENLREIIKATEKIKHKVDIDKKGNKLSTIILGNKEYKILEPNLEGISDEKYSSYATESHTNIQRFKRMEADLDGMRGNNPDERLNKKIANYIKTKESEGFTIPGENFKTFLSELGEKTGIEKIEGQLLMLMYLTGMDGNYWYSMDGGRIKCEYPMFWSNVGNVSGGLLLMSSKELKE